MYTITFENAAHDQWTCEFLFETFGAAEDYLKEKSFYKKNGIFERENYNWSKKTKAYITPRKIYKSK